MRWAIVVAVCLVVLLGTVAVTGSAQACPRCKGGGGGGGGSLPVKQVWIGLGGAVASTYFDTPLVPMTACTIKTSDGGKSLAGEGWVLSGMIYTMWISTYEYSGVRLTMSYVVSAGPMALGLESGTATVRMSPGPSVSAYSNVLLVTAKSPPLLVYETSWVTGAQGTVAVQELATALHSSTFATQNPDSICTATLMFNVYYYS